MVLTTVNSDSIKKTIIESVLEQKLAACIQSIPIHSHYIWDGSVQEDHEQILILKTQKALYSKIESLICDLHNYDVPQIVQVPFTDGFNPYLSWIEQSTQQD
ncbi:divalent-cation tolerance protein CutA [Vibrio hannami]